MNEATIEKLEAIRERLEGDLTEGAKKAPFKEVEAAILKLSDYFFDTAKDTDYGKRMTGLHQDLQSIKMGWHRKNR